MSWIPSLDHCDRHLVRDGSLNSLGDGGAVGRAAGVEEDHEVESVVWALEPSSSRGASLVDGRVVDSDGNPEFVEVFLAVDDFQKGSGLVRVDQVDRN
eukprot:1045854-Heterocapsa_arctica.AAC.1